MMIITRKNILVMNFFDLPVTYPQKKIACRVVKKISSHYYETIWLYAGFFGFFLFLQSDDFYTPCYSHSMAGYEGNRIIGQVK